MSAKVWVTCGPNGPVHMPGVPRKRGPNGEELSAISDREIAVEVEDNRFTRRRIAIGDLVLVREGFDKEGE